MTEEQLEDIILERNEGENKLSVSKSGSVLVKQIKALFVELND